ncbi:hypothetical protein [Cohnella sp. GCM10027633]|uniref:hypothetical protein n=1 Tax=unclassified Cohnella TaxID=2636738 RepID=UPI003630D343
MRKIFSFVLCFSLIFSLFTFGDKASAYEGGLIAPNPLKDYVDTITDEYTDNNENTSAGIHGSNYVWYEFASATTITAFKMKANYDVDLLLYDSQNLLIDTVHFLWNNSTATQHVSLPQPINSVYKVVFKPKVAMTIWELDVFGYPTPTEPDTGRVILTINISGGQVREYDLSTLELNAFLNWYDAKDAGTGPSKYAFTKTWNKGPFKSRTEYVIFDKILAFDVDEYEVQTEE